VKREDAARPQPVSRHRSRGRRRSTLVTSAAPCPSCGAHVIYDSVGRDTFLAGLDVLAPRGMMVLFGQSSGAAPALDPQLLSRKGSLFLTRPTLGHYTATRDELLWRAGELLAWIASGELSVRIGAEFALANAAEAHRALESRRTTGKVLLT
jgi:NADPH:quinone reductase